MQTGHPIVEKHNLMRPQDGELFGFGPFGGRFKIGGAATGGRFVVAEMPEILPRTPAAPLHRHNNEDEYTYVVAGILGVMAGDEIMTVGAGTWLIKPHGEWHTFWSNPAERNADVFFSVPPGTELPRHWHTSAERMVLVSGELHLTFEGQKTEIARPGTYIYGPPKLPHEGRCGTGDPCILFIALDEPIDAIPAEDG